MLGTRSGTNLTDGRAGISSSLRTLERAQTQARFPGTSAAQVGVQGASSTGLSPAGIPNFHVIHPFLLRGAAPSPTGIENLKQMGVKTVIDLRATGSVVNPERRRVERLGMHSVNIPMTVGTPRPTQVQTFLNIVSNPANQPVFVHCTFGADRTGTVIGIYRELVDHWSFPQTYREMRQDHFHPVFYKLKAAVRRYGGVKK